MTTLLQRITDLIEKTLRTECLDEMGRRGWDDDVPRALAEKILAEVEDSQKPVDMIIFCPRCGVQHVDEPTTNWDNPPHKSHLCLECSWIFRVADVSTNGVRDIATHGAKDNLPIRSQQSLERMTTVRYYGIDLGSK